MIINRTPRGHILRIAFGILALIIIMAAYAGAQPAPLTIQRVWTEDASGNSKATFAPGDTIRFKAELNNPYGGMMLAANGARLGITTNPNFYSDTTDGFPPGKPVDIPSGVSTWTWSTTAPSGPGEYTVTVKAYDHFAGALPEGSANFTVASGSPSTPSPVNLTPTPIPSTQLKPVFVYPADGQKLDYEGSYLFKVEPIANSKEFLWGFFQNGQMVWENYRDEKVLSGTEYGIHPETIAHGKFVPGKVEVWVRALINGQWTDPAIITIYLQPKSAIPNTKPTLTATIPTMPEPNISEPTKPIVIPPSPPGSEEPIKQPEQPMPKETIPIYCIGGIPGKCNLQNAFYPGINWETKNLNDLTQKASQLDAILMRSYENTDSFSGAFHVWLAKKGIPTKENYLDSTNGDGYHPIAFAHSGGTQTLVKKIEDGKVTADYVVLAAPALIEQPQLEKLIKDGKIKKKVIIFQSEKDLLYQFKARAEKEHVSSGREVVFVPSYRVFQWRTPNIKTPEVKIPEVKIPIEIPGVPDIKTPEIKIPAMEIEGEKFPAVTILSDIRIKDLDISILGVDASIPVPLKNYIVDATELFKKSKVDMKDKRIPNDETFWIGGASRDKQQLFTNWSLNNDGNLNIIAIDLTNDPLFSRMNYGEVHGALRDNMTERFVKGEYPFDGKFEGLKKTS